MDEIRKLLGSMVEEMSVIWCHAGLAAEASAVAAGGDTDDPKGLLRLAWRKSGWYMPELKDRVERALA